MATGTSTNVHASAFHADESEETNEYRSLSVSAIVALLLGLASPLSFGHVLLTAIPIAGIVVALVALRQIASSEGALAGRGAAIIGLVLCVAFAVAPHARAYILRSSRTSQAREFGRQWLDSVAAGELERAFRLTFESTRRSPPQEPGMPAPTKTPYEQFVDQPAVKALVAAGKDAEIRYLGTTSYDSPTFKRVTVGQKYSITPKSTTGDAKPLEAVLTLQRARLDYEGRMRWLVISFADPSQPAVAP
jgi:hypothetical protein